MKKRREKESNEESENEEESESNEDIWKEFEREEIEYEDEREIESIRRTAHKRFASDQMAKCDDASTSAGEIAPPSEYQQSTKLATKRRMTTDDVSQRAKRFEGDFDY